MVCMCKRCCWVVVCLFACLIACLIGVLVCRVVCWMCGRFVVCLSHDCVSLIWRLWFRSCGRLFARVFDCGVSSLLLFV